MKLRSKIEMLTGNSSTVTATVPVLPPDISRLQTPPISELSNAGSIIARKGRLSDHSTSIVDKPDLVETIDPVSPTENRRRPTITVPAAPLTKTNLAKHQEEITSAVEIASEDEPSPPPPTPNTRLAQMRNYLLTEDIDTDPEFRSRCLLIAEYLKNHQRGRGRKEVLHLLEQHNPHTAGSEQPTPRRSAMAVQDSSGNVTWIPAEDHLDPAEQADPFYWNHKLDDLTDRVRRHPSGGKETFAISELQELARPLNGGHPPSPREAYHLINEQMIKENHENESPEGINHNQLWAFEKNLPRASKEKKFSLDRWSGHPPGAGREPVFKLGEGSLMPQEMMDVDWDRDRSRLEESLERFEDGDGAQEAQLLLAETPLLQALMSDQIESDLAASTYMFVSEGTLKVEDMLIRLIGLAGVKKGGKLEPVAVREPAVLMTQKFALPRPAKSRIDEAVGQFAYLLRRTSIKYLYLLKDVLFAEIARSLNIQRDPPTPSPRTALFLKRKFEQCSDSETEEEEGEDVFPAVDSPDDIEREFLMQTFGRLDGSVGGVSEMSGALQEDQEGDDELYPYSDD